MPYATVDFPWTFDQEGLHRDVKAWCKRHGFTIAEGMELCGLTASWSTPRTLASFPTVANLMTVCSLMELDPRDYFVLDLP